MRRRWRVRAALGLTTVVLGSVAGLGSVASAAPPADCTTTASATQPGYSVADPHCGFAAGTGYTAERFSPLTDAAGQPISRILTGVANGAAYRMEVPANWNHELVLFAHGYRGTGTTVWVDDPDLRRYYIERGFAWAASSYQTNGYDVGHGVTDTHALIDLFAGAVEKPNDIYMTGLSMGGQVTAVEIEHYPGEFVAAMPYCGVLGDKELFDYFLDVNVTAAALTTTAIDFPTTAAAGAAYVPTYAAQLQTELPQLGAGFNTGNPATVALTDTGTQWAGTVEQRSGGNRPGFDSAIAYWSSFGYAPLTADPFLFGVYPGLSGGTIGVAAGNITDNERTRYRFASTDGRLTPAERTLNRDVLRVDATTGPSADLTGIPKVGGDPDIPVLSLHGLGDLFVPFSMEQIYASRVAARGESDLFVSRAIRENGHCEFTQPELRTAFADLVTWARTGDRPAGDDILDRGDVAEPAFGCRFTDPTPGAHRTFVGAACPPPTGAAG